MRNHQCTIFKLSSIELITTFIQVRRACGHVDVGTCPHQVLAATLTLYQPGRADYAHPILVSTPSFESPRRACVCSDNLKSCGHQGSLLLEEITLNLFFSTKEIFLTRSMPPINQNI
jgi:hypothetical protein